MGKCDWMTGFGEKSLFMLVVLFSKMSECCFVLLLLPKEWG